MKVNFNNKQQIEASFSAKLSPALREMISEYRENLRSNNQFDEFNRLRTTMVKIKFLCPGKEISDIFILDNKTPLLKIFTPKYCDNNVLEQLLEELTKVHNLNNTLQKK